MPTDAQAQAAALRQAALQRAEVLDRLSVAFARRLARVLRDLERSVVLRVPAFKAGGRTATIQIAQALSLRAELRAALREAGYDRLVDETTAATFARLERAVAATTVGRQVARFIAGDPALERLRALRVLAATGLDYQGDEVAIALWDALVKGVYTQQPTRDIVETLAMVIDRTEREARTLYDTATATYTRVLEELSTPPGEAEAFLYAGPDDLKTRRFCQAHVDRVYTRKAIAKMDNDTPDLGDVFRYGGGYNCRHVWMHVPAGTPLAEWANTGDRIGANPLGQRRAA